VFVSISPLIFEEFSLILMREQYQIEEEKKDFDKNLRFLDLKRR
jgi:hypothetical protein